MKLVVSLILVVVSILGFEAFNPRIHGYRKSLKASFAVEPQVIINLKVYYYNLNFEIVWILFAAYIRR